MHKEADPESAEKIHFNNVKRVIREEVRNFEEQGIRDWSTIKSTLKDNLRDYIFQRTKRNPMILPIIMEV